MTSSLVVTFAVAATAGGGAVQGVADRPGPGHENVLAALWQDPGLAGGAPAPEPEPPPFGTKGSWRWQVQAAGAFDVRNPDDAQHAELGGGFTYFIVDYLSLELELDGVYIHQPGDDAFGINFNLLGRWHFLVRDRWTLYADLGAGVMVTTAEAPGPTPSDPRGGGNLSFTPQAGAGFSFEVADNTRLLVGARWHHISNARTNDTNPPRDSLLLYAAISLPF